MPCSSRLVPGLLAICIAAVVGCDSAKHLAPNQTTPVVPNQTGSMTVTVTAADGTAPSVVVTGPHSYSKTITGTQTLSGLAIGSYTIVADSAVGRDSVVGSIIDTGTVTTSPAVVVNGATTTVTVSYAMKYHVGGLWIANIARSTIPELASNQLRHSGKPVPAETLSTRVSSPAGLALDASGNMWESSSRGDSILMYTPAARNAGGSAAPSLAITSPAIEAAENIVFDAHGNLWVAQCGEADDFIEFTPAQLAAGGAQTPAVTITGGPVVTCPFALAFDSSGNAWAADRNGGHIVKYSAAQLVTSGAPTPVDTIGANVGSLNRTVGLAFDSYGNLWVANRNTNTVVAFSPTQLAAGGAPVPYVTVTLPVATSPRGIVFDDRGTLWVSDGNNGIMLALTSTQLAATGAPAPAVADTVVALGGCGFRPQQAVFDPVATAVGISTARTRHPVAPLARRRRQLSSRKQGAPQLAAG